MISHEKAQEATEEVETLNEELQSTKEEKEMLYFLFQAEDGIRDDLVTGVQTCALPISSFTDVHRFAKAMAQRMVEESPRKLTLEYLKANREDKIYVDVNRNAYAQHAVVPYSVRTKPRAPVAVPLHWDELSDAKLRSDRFTVASVGQRIDAEGDPWKGMGRRARALPA